MCWTQKPEGPDELLQWQSSHLHWWAMQSSMSILIIGNWNIMKSSCCVGLLTLQLFIQFFCICGFLFPLFKCCPFQFPGELLKLTHQTIYMPIYLFSCHVSSFHCNSYIIHEGEILCRFIPNLLWFSTEQWSLYSLKTPQSLVFFYKNGFILGWGIFQTCMQFNRVYKCSSCCFIISRQWCKEIQWAYFLFCH